MTDQHLDAWRTSRDPESFRSLVLTYQDMVFNTCLRILHDRSAADDATQETFLTLIRQEGMVTGHVGAWLHRCARSRALDLLRSERARADRERASTTGEAVAAAGIADGMGHAELRAMVDQALDELDPADRSLLVACYLQAHTQQDIARESGQSQSTVNRRIEAAAGRLRDRLRRLGLGTILLTFLPIDLRAGEIGAACTSEVMKIGLAMAGGRSAAASAGMGLTAAGLAIAGVVIAGAVILSKPGTPLPSVPEAVSPSLSGTTPTRAAEGSRITGAKTSTAAAPTAQRSEVGTSSRDPTGSPAPGVASGVMMSPNHAEVPGQPTAVEGWRTIADGLRMEPKEGGGWNVVRGAGGTAGSGGRLPSAGLEHTSTFDPDASGVAMLSGLVNIPAGASVALIAGFRVESDAAPSHLWTLFVDTGADMLVPQAPMTSASIRNLVAVVKFDQADTQRSRCSPHGGFPAWIPGLHQFQIRVEGRGLQFFLHQKLFARIRMELAPGSRLRPFITVVAAAGSGTAPLMTMPLANWLPLAGSGSNQGGDRSPGQAPRKAPKNPKDF